MSAATLARPVGGFFPLDLGPAPGIGRSVAERWFGGCAHRGYPNARSALALGVLANGSGIGTLWLPGPLCAAVVTVAEDAARRGAIAAVARAPLAPHGPPAPDPAFLAERLMPGDAVLVASAFGEPAPPALRALAAARRDVLWIEDRANAPWPGDPWGDAVLYSPRKLLGVPDGGYLVLPRGGRLRPPPPAPDAPRGVAPLLPALRRFEDAPESRNADWFAAHRARETAEGVHDAPPSRLTEALLERLDFDAIAARRRANWRALRALLPPALRADDWPESPDWVPRAVPVTLPDAAGVARRMAEARVFCSRPWPDPSPPDLCPRGRALAAETLLLPCDHRYGPPEMERVAAAMRRALR